MNELVAPMGRLREIIYKTLQSYEDEAFEKDVTIIGGRFVI